MGLELLRAEQRKREDFISTSSEYRYKGYIYRITNLLDGKSYVGQTKANIKRRIRLHLWHGSHCHYIHNALMKYGVSSFLVRELAYVEVETEEILTKTLGELEEHFCKEFSCLHPNGYNLKTPGMTPRHSKESVTRSAAKHKKPIICNETGKIYPSTVDAAIEMGCHPGRISRVLRRRRKHYRKLSFSYYGENHRGKQVCPVVESFMKINRRGKSIRMKRASYERMRRPIVCHESGKLFPSIREAAQILHIDEKRLATSLRRGNITINGLSFSYVEK